MLRFYEVCAFLCCLTFALASVGATVIGQGMHSPQIAYFESDGLHYSTTTTLTLFDMSRHLTLPLLKAQNSSFGTRIILGQGDLFAVFSCDSLYGFCTTYIQDQSSLRSIGERSAYAYGTPTWSVDGRLAFVSCDQTCDIKIWNNGEVTILPELAGQDEQLPAWSSDGRLAFETCGVESCDIGVWDGNAITHLTQQPMTTDVAPAWSDDGRLSFIQCDLQLICQLMLWDGSALQSVTFIDPQQQFMTWSGDGRLAYGDCIFGRCHIVVRSSTQTDIIADGDNAHEISPTWSDDGRIAFQTCIAYASCEAVVWDGVEVRNLSHNPTGNSANVRWHHEWVTFGSCDTIQCDLMLWDGSTTRNLTNTSQQVEASLTWIDDQRFIFASCGVSSSLCDIMLWDGQTIIPLTQTPDIREFGEVWLP